MFKFGQLILRKIIKTVATRCHILRLICTKFDFGWGSTPDPAGELRVLPQTSRLDLKHHTSKGRGREREGRTERVEGEGERGDWLLQWTPLVAFVKHRVQAFK